MKSFLHALTLTQICQLGHMCSPSTGGVEEKELDLSALQSYDVDAINIMLSRVDSVENFTDLTAGVGPKVDKVVSILAETFPLLSELRIREDQRNMMIVLANRFLMALDYKLRSITAEGLREHLHPCKKDASRS